jgi:hypothetical protein
MMFDLLVSVDFLLHDYDEPKSRNVTERVGYGELLSPLSFSGGTARATMICAIY